MNKKDLDALSELYLNLYDFQQLDEAPVTGVSPLDRFLQGAQAFVQGKPRPTGVVTPQIKLVQQYRDAGGSGAPPAGWKPGQSTKPKPKTPTGTPSKPIGTPTGTPPKPIGTPTGTPSRPAAPSTVLAKKSGVEGKLDKATGKFTSGAFSSTEKSRYASVAAQNAAKNVIPKPPAQTSSPAIGKLGSTTFERRTPTSTELKAAQAARASGASPEKALQSAKMAGAGAAAASKPTTNQTSTAFSSSTPALSKSLTSINNTKPSKPPTPGTGATMQKQSYEWTSVKTLKDIAEAYQSVYEAKANDGNLANNYPPYDKVTRGDVIAGRLGKDEMGGKKKSIKKEEVELVDEKYMGFKSLKASIAAKGGVRDPGAVAASIGRKKYGKEKFQAAAAKGRKMGEEYQIITSYLLENNFASSQENADAIIENMSENWMVQILEETN